MEQELRVARVIQETLLPQELPELKNGKVSAYWRPARAVSGDFYDFLEFPDGRLGIVTGDVTGKGVPAALVMATTRTILRAAAERLVNPGQVLERANNLLCPDIPRNMFVTCLYVLLDPTSGKISYANAGHNLPQKCSPDGAIELRATGMPLGLMPEMNYEEKEAHIAPGENLLLYSDGLVEAHNPEGEMFGFPRLHDLILANLDCSDQIKTLMDDLARFTGPGWEQEDDVTFVTIRRLPILHPIDSEAHHQDASQTILEFSLASEPGNERLAMEEVGKVVEAAGFPKDRLEKLKTAVAEATLNAIEHGNKYDPNLPATICVTKTADRFTVYITDNGGGKPIPEENNPDLDAKLSGLQSPRGWGLFLIKSMVDEMKIHTDSEHHTVELIFLVPGSAVIATGESV
jgi:anti-sigma regulatory factor (Ser/Thr protein kinase)